MIETKKHFAFEDHSYMFVQIHAVTIVIWLTPLHATLYYRPSWKVMLEGLDKSVPSDGALLIPQWKFLNQFLKT